MLRMADELTWQEEISLSFDFNLGLTISEHNKHKAKLQRRKETKDDIIAKKNYFSPSNLEMWQFNPQWAKIQPSVN